MKIILIIKPKTRRKLEIINMNAMLASITLLAGVSAQQLINNIANNPIAVESFKGITQTFIR